MLPLDFMVTLQPNFEHFADFANDRRLAGIRLNNPHWSVDELKSELNTAANVGASVPLYFDVKGWQLRVIETNFNESYLDITINHPIQVKTPTMVIFKAGADSALLESVQEDGHRLIFRGGPRYLVKPGESLQIRHPSLNVLGEQFVQGELEKIEVAKQAGITRFFLSYVEDQSDVDRFRELIGKDAEIMLKIENLRGLSYVAKSFRKQDNLRLVAARGDLYVEIGRPHEIMSALRLIINADSQACVGSRLMLSVVHEPVPSCADFLEMAWLYDVGYRSMLLCDELCLKRDLLSTALNACESFRQHYELPKASQPSLISKRKSFWKRWGFSSSAPTG